VPQPVLDARGTRLDRRDQVPPLRRDHPRQNVTSPRTTPAPGWYSWGYNYSGCLGNGAPAGTNQPHNPTAMLLPAGCSDIHVGDQGGLGLVSGSLYGWGDNTMGGVGLPNGSAPSNWVTTPQLVPGISSVSQFGAGSSWGGALKSDGTLWFTGRNDQGQFGNGSFSSSGVFGFVQTTTSLPIISKLRLHDNLTSLIDTSGNVWMSGYRADHRMPDNNSTASPTRYTSFTRMTSVVQPLLDVAVGAYAGVALYADGTVWTWGDLGRGLAGNGVSYTSPHYVYVPQQVPGLSGIVAIAASYETSFALKGDGTLYAWGAQGYQEAGFTGHAADSGDPILSPTVYPLPSGVGCGFIGYLTPYMESTILCGTDHKLYGSGYNDQANWGGVCRLAEQPAGTSTWYSIPSGPTNGYPEFGPLQLQVVTMGSTHSTYAHWSALAAGVNQVSIVG
jgi:alpha-tubulin suppressor-like RCC1 family protein